ncbi:MAG TPA: LON peptidase substrate-binding domain-containing protein [Candidatus Baltobacteraceae bacterium]|nr:LON peptidase substrate-binding domain-containing protein [Candidatus Baltobacteraceae bacterium]
MSARLRLFPLNAVLFPGAALNLHVFEPRYKQMIGECLEAGGAFGVVLIRDGNEAGDPTVETHQVGSIAEIVEVTPLPFGRFYVSTVGKERFRIRNIVSRDPYLTVEAETLAEVKDEDASALAKLEERVRESFLQYLDVLAEFAGEPANVDLPADPASVSYIIADALQIADTAKQRLLEINSTKQRLTMELSFLRRLLPQMRTLLERREAERRAKAERGEDDAHRTEQERYFGKYFSLN